MVVIVFRSRLTDAAGDDYTEMAAEMLATGLLGANFALAVAFGAEAGQFQQAGLSTVIVGPGSIEQAHKADEFVSLDQLGRCEAFLDRLAATLSG